MITHPRFVLQQRIDSQPDASSTSSQVAGTDKLPAAVDTSTMITIGWREWVSLPQLGIPAIKAKVDTGARTSAVHAVDIKPYKHDDGSDWVDFTIQPIQRNSSVQRRCKAPVLDVRRVTDSGGHRSDRYFISTDIRIGSIIRRIELTLSQREDMLFRMLLGRTAMVPGIVVVPQLSYSLGRKNARRMYADAMQGGAS